MNKKLLKYIVVIFAVLAIMPVLMWNSPKKVSAKTVKAGWVTQKEGIKYRNNKGVFSKSKWEKISGKWFYFNKKGVVVTGWRNIGGKTYFLSRAGKAGTKGKMLSGWKIIDKKRYRFASSGELLTGWQRLSGNWFYFTPTGKAGVKGRLCTGWQTIGGKRYYLKANGGHGVRGRMFVGTHTIAGKKCYFNSSGEYIPTLADRVAETKTAKKTNQIITVANGKLTLWEKKNNTWQSVLSVACKVGRNGVGNKMREGDNITPAGAYTMSLSFGLGNNPKTKLPYRKITPNSYWISNPADRDYNTWQERSSSSSLDEHLITYSVYKYSIVIDYNTKRIPNKGSAIFLHCSSGSSTAGCVAVPESTMLKLMQRVDKGSYILMGKTEAEISKY